MGAAFFLCLYLGAGSVAPATDFDFNLLEAPKAPVVDLQHDVLVKRRRTMLQAHQIAGLSTLALMATTVVLGQLNFTDMYTQGGGHTGRFAPYHQAFAYGTTGGFLATASLSLFAPAPFEKRTGRIDAATVHKVAVGLASAGMATQIALGFITARQADAGNGHRLPAYIKAHQIVGYSTMALLSTAAVVWVF
jgi:hypothetical protein